MKPTIDMYKEEIVEALKNYDKYIVCLGEAPDQFSLTLQSLIAKAITVYDTRQPGMRNSISLNKYATVILSQPDNPDDIPICCIYFNLSSKYSKRLKTFK